MSFDLVGYFVDGGPIMWPLLLLSVIALACIIEKILAMFLLRKKMSPEDFMHKMNEVVEQEPDKVKAADQLIDYCKQNEGSVSDILLEGLVKYKETIKNKLGIMDSKEWINNAIEEKGRVEIPELEKRLTIISTVAMVSPLVGLLGTVTGMIVAFTVMAESAGGAKPDELAGGISQALITTATGLIIAIPTLIVYNMLRAKIDDLILEIEEVSIMFADRFIEK